MKKYAVALSFICICFFYMFPGKVFSLTLPHELPWTNDGITYTDVFASHSSDYGGSYYYHYYNNPQNMSNKNAYDYVIAWGNGINNGYDVFQIYCDANNSNCTTAYYPPNPPVGSGIGPPSCWTPEYLLTTQPLLWMNSYSGLCGIGDVVQGTYFPANYSSSISQGPVGYWSFNNCDAFDDSGNGHLGSPFGNPPPQCEVDGLNGKAFNFSGQDNPADPSRFEIPHSDQLNPTQAVTVSIWFKEPTPSPAYSSLVFKAASNEPLGGFRERVYSIWTRSDQGIHFASTIEGAGWQTYCNTGANTYKLNDFVHIVGVIDTSSQTMKIYINGNISNTCTDYWGSIRTGIANLIIGSHVHSGGDQYNFNGIIDEVRIYNRALSDAEVLELYNSGTTPSIVPPLKDISNLIMTKSDVSNFATKVYYNYYVHEGYNHNADDLALSTNGTRTGSSHTVGKDVYPICDGNILYVDHKTSLTDMNSVVMINHPNCNGVDVNAYYAHIDVDSSLPNGILATPIQVKISDNKPIGKVSLWYDCKKDVKTNKIKCYSNLENSHLHLMIDRRPGEDLTSPKYYLCNYTINASNQVDSLSNCTNGTSVSYKPKDIGNNQMIIYSGWGHVITHGYKDNQGIYISDNQKLFITNGAMGGLGFKSFFDLYNK